MQKTINRTGTELEIKKHNREKKSNNEKKIVKKNLLEAQVFLFSNSPDHRCLNTQWSQN